MSQANFESVLKEARKLPLEEQSQLAAQLLEEIQSEKRQRALNAVERTCGRIKGLDRETIIWLAEDEELCGY
jgi:hypothetical protein